MIYNVWLFDVD